MRPAEAGRDEGEASARRRTRGVGPAHGQLVDADPARVLVQRQGGGHRLHRRSDALAPQYLRLVPGVGGQLDLDPLPGVREEGLVAVLEEAPDPAAYGSRVGQQLLGELDLLRPPGRRHVQCAAAHPGVRQRGGRPGPVLARAGELQGGGDEPLVVEPVEDVQVLGEGRAGPAVAAADTGERHEHIGEGVPPEEVRLVHPVREVRLQRRGRRGRPAVQARVVPGFGERMQSQPQLGEGEISKKMRSGGRSAMSMCTLTPP